MHAANEPQNRATGQRKNMSNLKTSGMTRRGILRAFAWIEGEYVGEAIHEINVFMRDWRNGKTINYDIRNVDIMSAAHRLMDATEPYLLLSGYRSPETNAMLRRRSGGVARKSLHMKGQAADLRLQSRTTAQMARAARSCAAGGVGRYSGSNFVHMDCGPGRSWGGWSSFLNSDYRMKKIVSQ